MQTWMYKLVYYKYRKDDWRPQMVDSMGIYPDDEIYESPMPDHLDELGSDKWELVAAVPVDKPESGLLLFIFKRPSD